MQNKLKSALESTRLSVEAFFRRQQWKEIFIFLFFLLLSSGFWLLQSLQQDYERRMEIPLRYKNIPAEWILSKDNPQKISVVLRDKGTTLMYYLWKANFVPVDISIPDLSHLSDSSLQVTGRMLDAAVSKQLIASTSIVSIEPREVELRYDILSSRLVTVVPNVSITTIPGFQMYDSIKVSHAEVYLYGSTKALDTITSVSTELVTLEKVSKTREFTARLDLPAGIKAEYETVKLTVSVEEFTEKKIQMQVVCPDIPFNYVLRMFPSNVEVVCNIPLSRFKDLTEEALEIEIPFREFEEYQATGKIPIKLTRKPSWVVSSIITPNELEFIIDK